MSCMQKFRLVISQLFLIFAQLSNSLPTSAARAGLAAPVLEPPLAVEMFRGRNTRGFPRRRVALPGGARGLVWEVGAGSGAALGGSDTSVLQPVPSAARGRGDAPSGGGGAGACALDRRRCL